MATEIYVRATVAVEHGEEMERTPSGDFRPEEVGLQGDRVLHLT